MKFIDCAFFSLLFSILGVALLDLATVSDREQVDVTVVTRAYHRADIVVVKKSNGEIMDAFVTPQQWSHCEPNMKVKAVKRKGWIGMIDYYSIRMQ